MNVRPQLLLSGLALVILGGSLAWPLCRFFSAGKDGVVFPMVELSFQLPSGPEPFAREIWGWIESDNEGVWVPAYYDGTGSWKLRYTPLRRGNYQATLFVEEQGIRRRLVEDGLKPENFQVKGQAHGSGFVRLNPANARTFVRDDGSSYYPVGLNIGWDMGEQGDVVAFLERLAKAEGNWSRIWMSHWDDKNLDWPQGKTLRPGEIDTQAALKWDRILTAAERLGIPFQLVLQHHGQYSSGVNAAWSENPWNKKNGGFLEKASDFFTDPYARLLTKQKYRYIVARYGYSSSIMAWELFNEVEFTDAGKTAEGREAVRSWHEEMAGYLRSIDPNRHLITTSAPLLSDPVWNVTDFYQQHAYPPDALTGSGGFSVDPMALSRPIFYGEIGSTDDGGRSQGDGGRILRDVLWGGLFSKGGATAQYWAWDQVDSELMLPLITAVARFVRLSGLDQGTWRDLRASVSTKGRADLFFGPGQRWESVQDPQLRLQKDGGGRPEGVRFSSTLRPRRGSGEREGTDSASFHVDLDKPGRWEITVNEVSPEGAALEMEVDGVSLSSKLWSAASPETRASELPLVLGVDLPAGTKLLRIKSKGADYFQISSVRLTGYGPELGARAMTNDRSVVLWVYRPDGLLTPPLRLPEGPSAAGEVHLEGLLDGKYQVVWWNTAQGTEIRREKNQVSGGRIELVTPPVHSDVAAVLLRLKN